MDGVAATPAGHTCHNCGAGFTGEYCIKCGMERKSLLLDHLEISISAALGGVSDIGRVRQRNEDFFALASGNGIDVLVICDGVSNSQQPDRAARDAAGCACETLLKSATSTDMKSAMLVAIQAADAAVRAIPPDESNPGEPAETTIVAAVHRGNELTLGWVGDSRAYWIDGPNLRQLTTDHSWVNEVVAAGEMTVDQAMHHANAHAITRTLGGPVAGSVADEPSIVHLQIGRDVSKTGWLLLCTDGFWDSQGDAAKFAVFVTERIAKDPAGDDAAVMARQLVADACAARGHDNTTVGLLRIE